MSTPLEQHIPSSTQQSALLRIPGEIRKEIFSYILSSDTGLNYPEDELINQLQYACRQLRSEAAWLELKLNPVVTFVGDFKLTTATERFLSFSRCIPPEYRCRLRVVRLHNDADMTMYQQIIECQRTLINLTAICEQNPQLGVKYRLTAPKKSADGLLELPFILMSSSLLILRILRQQAHDPDIFPPISLHEAVEGTIRSAMKEHSARLLKDASPATKEVRARIRIFPPRDLIEPDPFRPGILYGPGTRAAHARGLLPSWEAIVKRWVQDGL